MSSGRVINGTDVNTAITSVETQGKGFLGRELTVLCVVVELLSFFIYTSVVIADALRKVILPFLSLLKLSLQIIPLTT